MATNVVGVELDLDKIQAEISSLSQEDLIKQLVEYKTRQKVTQKKYYNPDTAKRARLKKAALIKAMEAKAKELGLFDQINADAAEAAAEQLGQAAADSDE